MQPLAREGGQGKEEQSSGISGCNGGRKEMNKFGIQPVYVAGREFPSEESFFPAEQVERDMLCFYPFYGHLLTTELPVFIKTISSVDFEVLMGSESDAQQSVFTVLFLWIKIFFLIFL